MLSIKKKEKKVEGKENAPGVFRGPKSTGRAEFNLHQESHYNRGERNSTRKSFIVAATPDGGDPP